MTVIKKYKTQTKSNYNGFTLIELIIVMAVLGIIIAASSSRLRDITLDARISSAINQITTDIDLAKSISMSKRKQIKIIFNQNNETYTVYQSGQIYTDYPGSNNGVVSLSDNSNSGVDITSINLNGSNTLTFTKWGDCLQGGTIILNNNREIHVKELTGYWEVVNS